MKSRSRLIQGRIPRPGPPLRGVAEWEALFATLKGRHRCRTPAWRCRRRPARVAGALRPEILPRLLPVVLECCFDTLSRRVVLIGVPPRTVHHDFLPFVGLRPEGRGASDAPLTFTPAPPPLVPWRLEFVKPQRHPATSLEIRTFHECPARLQRPLHARRARLAFRVPRRKMRVLCPGIFACRASSSSSSV